jgi:hypothetical protein
VELTRPTPDTEIRQSARSEQKLAAKQQAETEVDVEKTRREKAEARERQNEKTRRDIAMAEVDIQEAAQVELKNNLKKLNKVWVAQQAAVVPGATPALVSAAITAPVLGASAGPEVRYHNGIKYERKQTGPFQGKLVSQAQLLSIDGEDYVEYRVLTQPSF